MAQTANPKMEEVHKLEVVRHQGKLMVPDTMDLKDVDKCLHEQMEYEDKVVVISEVIEVFPWDGAVSFQKAMEEEFGWVRQEVTPSFFGDQPPELRAVEVGQGVTKNVAWGRFSLPGLSGWVGTAASMKDGRLVFAVQAQTKRKYEPLIRRLVARTR